MDGESVTVRLTVGEWEKVLHALASHDHVLWERIADRLRAAADERQRASMVPPWQ